MSGGVGEGVREGESRACEFVAVSVLFVVVEVVSMVGAWVGAVDSIVDDVGV